ncbi:hypothetical protein MNV49_000799 [Pseudohyphozyma bogoriensis]|nr:hypothetical protein MNV49_000799 [Pseudohyphozyma bogoriensis]
MPAELLQPVSTIYSHEFWRPVTTALYLIGLMALSSMITRRMPRWKEIRGMQVPAAKVALLLTLTDSLLFVFSETLLVLGVGTSFSGAACTAGIWMCITFYAFTKVLITWFLVERVHIVHSKGKRRGESMLYKCNMCLMLGWVAVWSLFVVRRLALPIQNVQLDSDNLPGCQSYHGAWIREDGACMLYLADEGTYLGFAVDITIDLYLSLLFAIPLYRGEWSNPELRWLAIKSILCTIVGMASTATNAFILTRLHGKELSWVCMASCVLDTLMNSTNLFIITSSESDSHDRRPSYAGSSHPDRRVSYATSPITLPRKTSVHYSVEVTSFTEVDESAPNSPTPTLAERRGRRGIDMMLRPEAMGKEMEREKKSSPFQDV